MPADKSTTAIPRKPIEIGKRFVRLVVTEGPIVRSEPDDKSPHRNSFSYHCLCDCGNETVVTGHRLRSGHTRSCGCLRDDTPRDQIKALSRKHGFLADGRDRPPEYNVWSGMKRRCYNPAERSYPRYGGRGITICDRWRESFASFYEDMGPRPSPSYSIERIANDQGYSPENCRWATAKEQAQNRHCNVYLEHDGKRLTIAEWSRITGIGETTIGARLRAGLSVAEALTDPVDGRGVDLIEYDGRNLPLVDWSRITGIRYGLLHQRLRLGWSPERALTEPSKRARKADR